VSGRAHLPRELRAAAIACMALAGMVGLGAAGEVNTVLHLEEVRAHPEAVAIGDPRVSQESQRAYVQTLSGMRDSRALILIALSFAAGLAFVSAARLLWPGGIPREAIRRVTAGATLASGILRILDGAQQTAIARQVGLAVSKLAGPFQGMNAEESDAVRAVAGTMAIGAAVAITALFGGGLVLLAQYLRSGRARQLIGALDASEAPGAQP